uniref:Uncharacterized protein n=1 Tax=Anguilla anguilla TaxID=7936 RepID=A0A0E9SN11_ANGAN
MAKQQFFLLFFFKQCRFPNKCKIYTANKNTRNKNYLTEGKIQK